MTVRPEPWRDQLRPPPHRFHTQDQLLDRWRTRRMSRRFAGVGVRISPVRLRELTAGAPLGPDELVNVNFALAATELERQRHHARVKRTRQQTMHGLVIAGLILAALNVLICMGYGFIALALHSAPW